VGLAELLAELLLLLESMVLQLPEELVAAAVLIAQASPVWPEPLAASLAEAAAVARPLTTALRLALAVLAAAALSTSSPTANP
jgi:hypothetical protein